MLRKKLYTQVNVENVHGEIIVSSSQENMFKENFPNMIKIFVSLNPPSVNKVKVYTKDIPAWTPDKVGQEKKVYTKSKGKDNKPYDDVKL